MVLDLPGGLFEQRDVRETPAGSSSSTSTIIAPIGTILAWLKTYASTPQALPSGWMEADGSAISDADSPYDGQNAPDLNGGEFIRGSGTSGGTGGSATIDNHNAIAIDNHTALTVNAHDNHTALDIASDSHTHDVIGDTGGPSGTGPTGSSGATKPTSTHTHSDGTLSAANDSHTHGFDTNIDAHSAHAFGQNISNHSIGTNIDAHSTNLPTYYNVVWIFRFK